MVAAIRKTSGWPFPVQFACTILIILAGFVAQLPLESRSFGDPFTVFLAGVFIVALMFGLAAGILAVVLSSVLSPFFFEPLGTFQLTHVSDFVQIGLYAALATAASFMADQIHRTLIGLSDTAMRLADEGSTKTLQLREMAHRVANNFASLDALIRLRANASKDPKIQFAFEQAGELVHVVARLSNRLNASADDSNLDSQLFVAELCEDLQACARSGISVECRAESHDIPLTAAVPLGLIVNELVTNALKYAFPDRKSGVVLVDFSREGDDFRLLVEDNGVGMSNAVKGGGLGFHLLEGFSRTIGGRFDIASSGGGTRVSLRFAAPPLDRSLDLELPSTLFH
jgi:two-component sensor histidine kinase